MVFKIVEVPCVSDVIFVWFVDSVILDLVADSIFKLSLIIEELSWGKGPGLKIVATIKCGEESVLLSPNEVLMLLAHSNAIHHVQMGEGDDDELVKVLNEGKPIIELTDVDLVALPSDSRG